MHSRVRRSTGGARPPVSLTRLVGRDRELADLEQLVGASRLVTLTGVGGAGKTRLAAELALRLDWQRPDSVAWVELASSSDPMLLAQQVAAALSLRENTLVDSLRERELLLVLDNCEHLIDACAAFAGTLLSQCPGVRIVATSREPLAIAGERVWPVPPLAIATEAVELFVDRATAVDPSFTLDAANGEAIEEICRRLDGIPLAIELAAARIRLLTPAQMAERLEDRFTVLSGGSRTAIPRHRTLRAAIDWSFALLSERDQKLLARLSVFAGSFSLEAVERVCSDDTIHPADILDLVGQLVDKSLVVSISRRSAVRYSLLGTIRQYAAERLAAMPDAEEVHRRHARTFLRLAQDALPELLQVSVAALDRLDDDHDNVRAALAWSLEHEPETIALPLAGAFRWYWYYRILWSEGARWMSRVLERIPDGADAHRAAVITGAGNFAAYLGDAATARTHLERAEQMWRTLGDERFLALTLSALAQLLATTGELDAAEALAYESVALARKSGTGWDVAYCLTNAAAFVAQRRGELDDADAYLEEAETIFTRARHPLGIPFSLNARALVALQRRDHAAAARFARAALEATRTQRELWFSSRSLRILAYTATNPTRAARLLGASNGMLRATTAGMLMHEQSEHERVMAMLRERLSAEGLEAELREGGRMCFEDACELALAVDDQSGDGFLHVADLGPLRITFNGTPLAIEGRSSGRARELLLYLLAHPEGRTKDEVGVAFWPDAMTEQVRNSFHVTLHRLRKLLGSADAVTAEGGRYRLAGELPHSADSRRFETELTAALRRNSFEAIEAALALYQGEYLQGEEVAEWCLPIRTRLQQLYLRGLSAYGKALESQGRVAEAAEAYGRIVALEPLYEPAWRQLMICRARLGSRSESLLLYRDLEQRLREDLAATPEPETRALYQRLKEDRAV